MLKFYTYILQSVSTKRYYCGYSKDPERRLCQHNDPRYRLSKTTKRISGPWKIVWKKMHHTASEAMSCEKRIKRRGIGRFLKI